MIVVVKVYLMRFKIIITEVTGELLGHMCVFIVYVGTACCGSS